MPVPVTTKDSVIYSVNSNKPQAPSPREMMKPAVEFSNNPQMVVGFNVSGSSDVIESTVPKIAKIDTEV